LYATKTGASDEDTASLAIAGGGEHDMKGLLETNSRTAEYESAQQGSC
jgi:hypothetical protein